MKPPSVTDMRGNLLGLAAMLATIGLVTRHQLDFELAIPLLLVATATPVLAWDLLVNRVHRRASTGLDWGSTRPRDPGRVATKWLGLAALAGGVGLAYLVFPHYHAHRALDALLGMSPPALFGRTDLRGELYGPYFQFLAWTVPLGVVGGALYVAWLDRYLVEPRDAYWHLGAALRGRDADRAKILDLVLAWVIKGFFTAVMYRFFVGNLAALYEHAADPDRSSFHHWFHLLYSLSFTVDLAFTTVGYLVAFRVFDTHVRSAEPTTTGWIAAIACYPPFFPEIIGRAYVVYGSGQWFEDFLDGPLEWAYGGVLLALVWVFSLSTVAFGCRFSNLTNRGTVTNWTYGLTKHPAYVSKICHFLLESVPIWYAGSVFDTARRCVAFLVQIWMYRVRARTEEQHLSRDPAYVQYALYMNERSMFAWVGRLFPALRYRPPEGAP